MKYWKRSRTNGQQAPDLRPLRGRQAGLAIGAAPHRVGEHELDERRHDPQDQQRAEEGERDVGRAGEQVRPHPADRAGGRRGAGIASTAVVRT